jgi:hypothetical protein
VNYRSQKASCNYDNSRHGRQDGEYADEGQASLYSDVGTLTRVGLRAISRRRTDSAAPAPNRNITAALIYSEPRTIEKVASLFSLSARGKNTD